jgi:sugar phosphate isomerase/epimerase
MSPATTSPIPFVLTAYGLPHVMGYLPTKGGETQPLPLGPVGLMEAAREMGLAGVEIPLARRVPSFDGKTVEVSDPEIDLREALEGRSLQVIADYGEVIEHPAEHLCEYLKTAAGVGAKVVRATLSNILCGDRRKLAGGWDSRLEEIAARLREVQPVAEDLGICLAVENHQDATTDDLLRLAEAVKFSPAFGITLDTGNPLAVGEGPVEEARRLAPIIRHLHLKDYTIHFAPEGYRLVRCAAGDGVVDFPAILEIVRANGHGVLPGIEIAAQATRTIPFLEDDWWACYPERPTTSLVAALRLLWEKGRPAEEPYSSAWERGEDSEAVSAEEWAIVRKSAEYFRTIHIPEATLT